MSLRAVSALNSHGQDGRATKLSCSAIPQNRHAWAAMGPSVLGPCSRLVAWPSVPGRRLSVDASRPLGTSTMRSPRGRRRRPAARADAPGAPASWCPRGVVGRRRRARRRQRGRQPVRRRDHTRADARAGGGVGRPANAPVNATTTRPRAPRSPRRRRSGRGHLSRPGQTAAAGQPSAEAAPSPATWPPGQAIPDIGSAPPGGTARRSDAERRRAAPKCSRRLSDPGGWHG